MAQTAMQPDAPSDTRPDAEQLIDKSKAAKILGIKERRVLQLVTQGKLEGVKHRPPGSTQAKVMFRIEDVRRFKAERDHPKSIDVTPAALVSAASPDALHPGIGRSLVKMSPEVRDFVYLMNAVNTGRTTEAPPAPNVFLTLAEAEQRSKIPAAVLHRLCRLGLIRSLDTHRRQDKYLIARSVLDAFEGEDTQASGSEG